MINTLSFCSIIAGAVSLIALVFAAFGIVPSPLLGEPGMAVLYMHLIGFLAASIAMLCVIIVRGLSSKSEAPIPSTANLGVLLGFAGLIGHAVIMGLG